MAWRSHGNSNVELIDNLTKNGLISSPIVAEAMKKVDRGNFVVDRRDAYRDSPQSIGYKATISAPHMHAHATENLIQFLQPGMRVLDVGSGSGYLCAVLNHLVSPSGSDKQGKVVGIDHIPQLVDMSITNLRKDGLKVNDDAGSRIEMVCGDGRKGYAQEAPYDAIHVGAAAPVLPQELVDQLAKPGRMFIPVDDDEGWGGQSIWQVDKDAEGNVKKQRLFGVQYVPLTDAPK